MRTISESDFIFLTDVLREYSYSSTKGDLRSANKRRRAGMLMRKLMRSKKVDRGSVVYIKKK